MPMNETEQSEKRVDRAFLREDLQMIALGVVLLLLFLLLCWGMAWLGTQLPAGGEVWL